MNNTIRIARILVPVDGSECSRHAADHAVRIGQAYGSEVIFLHAVDTQLVEELAQRAADDGQRVREQLLDNGRAYVRDITRLAAERQLQYQAVVEEGDPCAVICDVATRCGVDLIVMGKIGRRGARRLLVGSITRRVTELTDRPVLIVSGPPQQNVS